jgi:hypothetical protein
MKSAKHRLIPIAAAIAAAAALVQPSWADHHDEHFHGDIGHFHEHDWALWRGGRWHHVAHDGRLGWWWVAGGVWYFYPAPVYPYPDPYAPPVVTVAPRPSAAPPPPAPQSWYYCEAARGYFPYVPSCPGGWRAVPATPGATAMAPPR